jgi:hypothetical protein
MLSSRGGCNRALKKLAVSSISPKSLHIASISGAIFSVIHRLDQVQLALL